MPRLTGRGVVAAVSSPSEIPSPELPAAPRRWWEQPDWTEFCDAVAGAVVHRMTLFLFAVGLLVGGVLLPTHGLHLSTCGMLAATGLPCPGCGMTRATTCALRGEWRAAWEYNPFGFMTAAAFAFLGPLVLLPRSLHGRVAASVKARRGVVTALVFLFVAGLLVHGVVRAVRVFRGDPSVAWWRKNELPPAFAPLRDKE